MGDLLTNVTLIYVLRYTAAGVHLVFSLITVAILLLHSRRKTKPRCYYRRFFAHNWFSVFTLAAIVVLVFNVLEGALSDVRLSALHIDTHVSNLLAAVAPAFVLLLYDHAERIFNFRYLVIVVLYWTTVAAIKAAILIELILKRHSSYVRRSAQFLFLCLVWSMYALHVILSVIVLTKEKIKSSQIKHRNKKREEGNEMEPDAEAEAETDAALEKKKTKKSLKRRWEDEENVVFMHSYVSFISKASLHWFTNLLSIGYRKCLTLKDLGNIPTDESAHANFEKLKAYFEEQKLLSKSPSLWRCLWRLTKREMPVAGLFKILSDALLYIPPFCLERIVTYLMERKTSVGTHESTFNASSSTAEFNQTVAFDELSLSFNDYWNNGYVIIVITFFVIFVQSTLFQNHMFISVREGIRCKCAVQSLVFDKSLRLYTTDVNEGTLLNHMTTDPLHIVLLFLFIPTILTMPFQIALGIAMLYVQLGTSALIGGMTIVLMIPVQYFLGEQLGRTQKRIMKEADERLKQSNELLQSIKLVKLYAWEKLFYQSIVTTRNRELRLMLRAAMIRVVSITITDGVPYFACILTFTLHHFMEAEPLHPGKVCGGLALFAIFSAQLFVITYMINVASQAHTSVSRLRSFFLLPEVSRTSLSSTPSTASVNNARFLSETELPVESLPRRSIRPSCPLLSESVDEAGLQTDDQFESLLLKPIKHSLQPPLNRQPTSKNAAPNGHDEYDLTIEGGNFGLNEKQILYDINLRIRAGELVIVVGSVGSGKTSLLWAILGEMKKLSGNITYSSDSIAFVSQSAWILNSTVRENVTLGLPYDHIKFWSVVKASGLDVDLQTFPLLDQTEIGEKGANLSGGQRQRLSIARALYSDSDIYLMDDPLSALDSRVGAHVFEEVIVKRLLRQKKTVILVTHHVHLLRHANHIVVMDNGRIFTQGNFNLILSMNLSLPLSLTKESNENRRHDVVKAVDKDLHFDQTMKVPRAVPSIKSMLALSVPNVIGDDAEDGGIDGHEGDVGRLIQEEEVSKGAVSLKYYVEYARAATWTLVILAISFYSTRVATKMGGDYWLMETIEKSKILKTCHPNCTRNMEDDLRNYYEVYVILTVIAIVLVTIGIVCLELVTLTASRSLHKKILSQIISAPLVFFDRTPIGRIMNRLSADLNTVDERFAVFFDIVLFCFLWILGGIVMNTIFVPYFLIPFFPMLIIFVAIQRFAVSSCRELQRLDCSTKSPVLAHFTQVLNGLTTIRAYRNEGRFLSENFEKVDANNIAFLFFNTCHIWLGLRLDFIGTCTVLIAGLSSITSGYLGVIEPATVGLVIAYAIMMCSLFNWSMRYLTETEVHFGSVQRIVQYSTIDSEPYEIGQLPAANWPSEGKIEFLSVFLKYSNDLEPVIKDFSLVINPGSKVGICGRTGSGKSSLTLSLFRMVVISHGRILLDDVDITTVPLELLRSKLSIIPQEPVLFSGTIRYNLDPLKTKTDGELMDVLKISQLDSLVQQLPDKLDTIVTGGGDNFSNGQRQMFCLARALLRNSKILIMDEATASIDVETDLLIQQIVKKAFVDCTVITIAHRLSSIENCDMIVVLRDGEKIEEGTPEELTTLGGTFSKMRAENQL